MTVSTPGRFFAASDSASSLSDEESYSASRFVLSVCFGCSLYNSLGGLKEAFIFEIFSLLSSSLLLQTYIFQN